MTKYEMLAKLKTFPEQFKGFDEQLWRVADRTLNEEELANEVKNVGFFASHNKEQYLDDELVNFILTEIY